MVDEARRGEATNLQDVSTKIQDPSTTCTTFKQLKQHPIQIALVGITFYQKQ